MSLAGMDLTNAPWTITGNSPVAAANGGTQPFASAYTVYTLDYNNGVNLVPSAWQYSNPGGNVDLRAQVRDTTGPYTYTWDTTNISSLASGITTSGYKLTFQWNTNISGGPYVANVGLTVTNGSSQQVNQTYTFYVPNGSGSAGTGTATWPTSLAPDLVSPGAPAWNNENVSVSANTGALNTSITLPSYNPNVPPVGWSTAPSRRIHARSLMCISSQLGALGTDQDTLS